MVKVHHFNINNQSVSGLITEFKINIHKMYKVVFENGYENIFFKDVESGKWVEEDLGFTGLAEQVGALVMPFAKQPVHVPRILKWHRETLDNGQSIQFGFYGYLSGNNRMYEIYHFNKKYQYTLLCSEEDSWQVLGLNEKQIQNINPQLLRAIIDILPIYEADYF
jgi:hypothetical protein